MNNMGHDEMIALIQAHKDGKPIQFRIVGGKGWLDSPIHLQSNPDFDFNLFEYRTDPKPREWCVQIDRDGKVLSWHLISDNYGLHSSIGAIRVREVLDDDAADARAEVNPEAKTSGACSLERAF